MELTKQDLQQLEEINSKLTILVLALEDAGIVDNTIYNLASQSSKELKGIFKKNKIKPKYSL